MHNNRIEEACNSTQRCANYWFLESKLRRGTLKILFQQYRPKADIKEIRQRGPPNTRLCTHVLSLAFSNFRCCSVGEPETYLLSTETGSIVTHTVLLFSGVARNLAEQ